MKGKQLRIRLVGLFCAFLLLFVALLGGQGILSAFAAGEMQYSHVLSDLQQDEEFNAEDYPDDSEDYSINFIQIAESKAGELFIYTYQPAQRTRYLVATKINMALSESADGTKLYDLKLLNSSGVFCKYMVKGVTVSNEATRYYNITSIYRKFLSGIDENSAKDTTVNAVSFEVGWVWKAETEGDTVTYSAETTEVITIGTPEIFSLRLSADFTFNKISSGDLHFFAFNTDKPVDFIIDADLEYMTRDYSKNIYKNSFKYETPVHHSITIKEEDIFTRKGAEYNRIMRVDDFLNEFNGGNIDDDTKNLLDGYTWIFQVCQTDYYAEGIGNDLLWLLVPFYGFYKFYEGTSTVNGTFLESVSLVRMKYSYDGKIYNVGVVSNTVTGPKDPVNVSRWSFSAWWSSIAERLHLSKGGLTGIVVIIALAILLIVLCLIFPELREVLAAIFKGLWFVISWPFKKIAEAIRKRREERGK